MGQCQPISYAICDDGCDYCHVHDDGCPPSGPGAHQVVEEQTGFVMFANLFIFGIVLSIAACVACCQDAQQIAKPWTCCVETAAVASVMMVRAVSFTPP